MTNWRKGRSPNVTNGRTGEKGEEFGSDQWEKGEESESDQWEKEGEEGGVKSDQLEKERVRGRSSKVTNGRMREKGGGVRVRKEVDRKRDEKKPTRRNNNLQKNHL